MPSPATGKTSNGSVWNSKSVEGCVQRQPDDVDKVPVQHRALDAKVAPRREMTHEAADQHAREDEHADRDVQTVQACEAEEDCSVDAGRDVEVLIDDQVRVLV